MTMSGNLGEGRSDMNDDNEVQEDVSSDEIDNADVNEESFGYQLDAIPGTSQSIEESEEAWSRIMPALFSFNTAASAAVTDGDLERLRELSKRKEHVAFADYRGWLPLHKAVFYDSYEAVELLIKIYKRGVHVCTHEGETPLLLACKYHGNMKIIDLLIRYNSDVNMCDNSQYSPLHAACRKNKLELVKFLVEHGANVNSQTISMSSPLHELLEREEIDIEIVNYLLNNGADVNLREENDRTPLFLAAENRHVGAVRSILEFVNDVDQRAIDGATPLMLAAQKGSLEIVNMLLAKGANPNLKSNDNLMAVHLSVCRDHVNVLKRLLEVTNLKLVKKRATKFSYTLLQIVISADATQCLNAILESDLNDECFRNTTFVIDTIDDFGFCYGSYEELCPISHLFKERRDNIYDYGENMLNILLENRFSVNAKSPKCMSPLVAAITYTPQTYLPSCIEKLTSFGANIDYPRALAPEALFYACKRNFPDVVLLLFQHCNFATPDSFLSYYILYHKVTTLPSNIALSLLKLGVSSPVLNEELKSLIRNIDPDKCEEVPSICDLKQLSRTAVRHMFFTKWSDMTIDEIMTQLHLPVMICKYLKYSV